MKLCPKCQKQFSDDANFCPVDAARLVPLEGQAVAVDPISAKFTLGARPRAAVGRPRGGRFRPDRWYRSGRARRLARLS